MPAGLETQPKRRSLVDSLWMETSSGWDYLSLLIVRPVAAVSFVILFISIGWWLAWKLVLVHVPLVQEIFGLRKKPTRPKPPTGRLSKYYSDMNAGKSNSSSG